MKPALLQVKLSLHHHPQETPKNQTFFRPQQPAPYATCTSGNAHSSIWDSKSPGDEKSEAQRGRIQKLSHTSLYIICFSQLTCCYFPHYTKGGERGRGEIRLLTTPRLTLHKLIHHDASPATEQPHENSHLLQFS